MRYEFSNALTRDLYVCMAHSYTVRLLANLLTDLRARKGLIGKPQYRGEELIGIEDNTHLYEAMVRSNYVDGQHAWEVDGVWLSGDEELAHER